MQEYGEDGTADALSSVGWHMYIAMGCTGVGSYTVRCDILELAAIQCGVIYWSWQLYREVCYTEVGSYTVWCDILELAAI